MKVRFQLAKFELRRARGGVRRSQHIWANQRALSGLEYLGPERWLFPDPAKTNNSKYPDGEVTLFGIWHG